MNLLGPSHSLSEEGNSVQNEENRNGSPCMYWRCDLGHASDSSVHSSDLYNCIVEDICEFFLEKVGENDVVFETGRMACNSDGSSTVRVGDLVVLGTAMHKRIEAVYNGRKPLSVAYRERAVATGKMAGTLTRREINYSDVELRTASLSHRALSSALSPKTIADTQVMLTLLSADGSLDVDATCINAASLALRLSQVDFQPVGAVRMALIAGVVYANPPVRDLAVATIDMLYAGTANECTLLHVRGNEAVPGQILELVRAAKDHVAALVAAQEELAGPRSLKKLIEVTEEEDEAEQQEQQELVKGTVGAGLRASNLEVIALCKRLRPRLNVVPTDELMYSIREVAVLRLLDTLAPSADTTPRMMRDEIDRIENDTFKILRGSSELSSREVLSRGYAKVLSEVLAQSIYSTGLRPDGRRPNEARELDCEASVLPYVHGSSLVNLGHAQALCTIALVPLDKEGAFAGYVSSKSRDPLVISWETPSFAMTRTVPGIFAYSRNEVDRAEIMKFALSPVIPHNLACTVRLHADVLATDGGGITTSVSAASLALCDAGISLHRHVAGISLGLVRHPPHLAGDGEAAGAGWELLVDPSELEEESGVMILHAAGTSEGVTCISLDTREGSPIEHNVLEDAILRVGECIRKNVLELNNVLSEAREEISLQAERTDVSLSFDIPPQRCGAVLGVKGTKIQLFELETDTRIIVNVDGKVIITGASVQDITRAKEMVLRVVDESEGQLPERPCVEVWIPDAKTRSRFIGRSGANIALLEQQTGCNIHIGDGCPARIVANTNERANLGAQAVLHHLAMLKQEVGFISEGHSPRVCVEFFVSDLALRSRFIGRSGQNVLRLEEETGCCIQVGDGNPSRLYAETQELANAGLKRVLKDLEEFGHTRNDRLMSVPPLIENVERLGKISSSAVAFVVAVGRRKVKKIEKDTRTLILVEPDGVVTITGECEDDVDEAMQRVEETARGAGTSEGVEKEGKMSAETVFRVIGKGRGNLKRIQCETNTTISIKRDGSFIVTGESEGDVDTALQRVADSALVAMAHWDVGTVYDAVVASVASDHAYLDVNKLSGTEQGSRLQDSVCVLIDKTQVTSKAAVTCDQVLVVGQRVQVICTQVTKDGDPVVSMRALEGNNEATSSAIPGNIRVQVNNPKIYVKPEGKDDNAYGKLQTHHDDVREWSGLAALDRMKAAISGSASLKEENIKVQKFGSVPIEAVEHVVGTGGKNLKRTEKTTRTNIAFSHDGSFTVTGMLEGEIDEAIKAVIDVQREERADERVERAGKVPNAAVPWVVGKGGSNVKSMEKATNTTISIEEDGSFIVKGRSIEEVEEALQRVADSALVGMTPWEVNKVYHAIVARVARDHAYLDVNKIGQQGQIVGSQGTIRVLMDKTQVTSQSSVTCDQMLSVGQSILVLCTQVTKDGHPVVSTMMRALQEKTNKR